MRYKAFFQRQLVALTKVSNEMEEFIKMDASLNEREHWVHAHNVVKSSLAILKKTDNISGRSMNARKLAGRYVIERKDTEWGKG